MVRHRRGGQHYAPAMAVSPQQLRSLRFDEGIRGYDKRQVDKVIRRVADLVEELENRVTVAERRAAAAGDIPIPADGEAAELDQTLRRTLILAQRTADAAIKEAREDADRIRQEAQAEADGLLAEARSTHEQLTSEVAAERSRLMTEARRDCDSRIAKVLTELRETHEAKRAELLEQVSHLGHVRDLLNEDIARLESHLAERRERIRAALADITAVLDDPDKLHEADAGPELAAVPDVESYEPVTVDIDAMDAFPEASPAPAAVGDGGPAGPATPTAVDEAADGDVDASGTAGDQDGAGDQGGADVIDLTSPTADEADEGADEPARPAWADAIPHAREERVGSLAGPSSRAAGGGDPQTIDRFFGDSEEDRRSGWFRRKP